MLLIQRVQFPGKMLQKIHFSNNLIFFFLHLFVHFQMIRFQSEVGNHKTLHRRSLQNLTCKYCKCFNQ